jgi:Flp pilus assembly protein TadB
MFVTAIVPPVMLAFLLFASPNYMYEQPSLLDHWSTWVAILLYLLGLAWMVRIYRADPEAGPSRWRFRGF